MTSSIRRPTLGTQGTVFTINPHSLNLLDTIKKKRVAMVNKYALDKPIRTKFPKYKNYAIGDRSSHSGINSDLISIGNGSDSPVSKKSKHTKPAKKVYLPRVRQESCLAQLSKHTPYVWRDSDITTVIEHRNKISDYIADCMKTNSELSCREQTTALHAYLDNINQLSGIVDDRKNTKHSKSLTNGPVQKPTISEAELRSIHSYIDSVVDETSFEDLRNSVSLHYNRMYCRQNRSDTHFLLKQSMKSITSYTNDASIYDTSDDSSGMKCMYALDRTKSKTSKRNVNSAPADGNFGRLSSLALDKRPESSKSLVARKCVSDKDRIAKMTITSSHTTEDEFNPATTLNNNYLRLSRNNVETLEAMCVERGFEPDLHTNSHPDKYNPGMVDMFAELKKPTTPPRNPQDAIKLETSYKL